MKAALQGKVNAAFRLQPGDGIFLPRWSGEKGRINMNIISRVEILMNTGFVVIGVIAGVGLYAILP